MRLLSWNVNGLRAALKKGFADFLARERPDVLALQEIKAGTAEIEIPVDGYHIHWNAAEKPGYSGTALLTRAEPLSVTRGMGIDEHDREGRLIAAEFDDFYLVDVYVPNAQRGLARLDYRTRRWDRDLRAYLKDLAKKKPVAVCGDFNVAHTEIDLANPKSNVKNAGFTPEERESFGDLLNSGFIDTFREFETDGGHYTWWTYRSNARVRNIGWRIDYFLISPALRPRLKNAFILPEIHGSDHCPVGIELQ